MNWDAHGQEYAAFSQARVEAAYRQHAGFALAQPLAALRERYSDLWQRENLAAMSQDLTDAPPFTDTERAGRCALRDALQWDYLTAQTTEIVTELEHYQAVTQLNWLGGTVTADNFAVVMAAETRPVQRHELAQRWGELCAGGDDLRAELWQQRRQAADRLGFANQAALAAATTGVDLAQLARAAENFLDATEKIYRVTLEQAASRWRPTEIRPRWHYADWLFWQHQTAPHAAFPARDLLLTYGDVVRGLGWRAGQQTNIIFDGAARSGKHRSTACFGVRPPEDVRLVYGPSSGGAAYREFFAAAGRAQHHAWTAGDLRARHPAFVYPSDAALNGGYAALWRGFVADFGWLREYRPALAPAAARAWATEEAFLTLAQVRRDCALLAYELATDTHGGPAETLAREKYVTGLSLATGFEHDLAFAISALSPDFAPATRLREQLLAASLSEYLRVRYGRRWWAVKRAGDELVDWWSTGARYHAEEIAPLVGAGALNFDLLAEQLTTALRVKK